MQHLGERGAAVAVVEADVEHRPRLGRDDVGGGVADVEAGDLQGGGLETLAAGVERLGGQARAARAPGGAPGCRRAADRRCGPACRAAVMQAFRLPRRPIFTDVAEAARAGRLADQRHVGDVAVRCHPLQHADGAVHRRAFLVAGDEQARCCRGGPGCAPRKSREAGDEGGDAALHVAGAAAVEHAVPHHGGEGVVRPARVAGRHHVGVAGPAEMRRAGAAAGEEVLDLSPKRSRWQAKPSGRSASSTTPSAPSSAGVTLRQRISAWASGSGSVGVVRRARAARGQSRSSSLMEVLARVCASTFFTITAQ